ncbi:hypothetical protein NL676_003743 [Syzygium grande]|nr:hypothetical protein NL676_003743 [Syzygium grande]
MAETIEPLSVPAPTQEDLSLPAMENIQASFSSVTNTTSVAPQGNSSAVLAATERPLGLRPILRGSTSHSRSRGRSKTRSRSRGRVHIVEGAVRSDSQTNPTSSSARMGQPPLRPQVLKDKNPTP